MDFLARLGTKLLDAASRDHLRASIWLFAFCLVLFLPGFFSLPPIEGREARFARTAQQILDGEGMFHLPAVGRMGEASAIGVAWLQALAVVAGQALSVADAPRVIWLNRSPSLAGAIGAVLLAYWCFAVMVGRREAFAAALLFGASVLPGVAARLAVESAIACAAAVAAMGVLARLWSLRATGGPHRSEVWLFWLAAAAAPLAGGWAVPAMAALAIGVLAWKERSAAWLGPLISWPGIVAGVIVASPWLVGVVALLGEIAFGRAALAEILPGLWRERQGFWAIPGAHAIVSLATFWPASAFILLAIPAAWRQRGEDMVAFCLAWALPAWLLLALMPTTPPLDMLLLLPPLALLATRSLATAPAERLVGWRVPASFVLPTIPLLFFVLALLGTLFLEGLTLSALPPMLLATPLFAAAIVLALAGWFLRARGAGAGVVVVAVLSAVCLQVAIYVVAWTGLRSLQIAPRLVESVRAIGCPDPKVASAGYEAAGLAFLLGRNTLATDGAGAARFLAEGDCRVALVEVAQERSFNEIIEKDGVASRLAGRQHGFDIVGRRRLDIGVYLREAER